MANKERLSNVGQEGFFADCDRGWQGKDDDLGLSSSTAQSKGLLRIHEMHGAGQGEDDLQLIY